MISLCNFIFCPLLSKCDLNCLLPCDFIAISHILPGFHDKVKFPTHLKTIFKSSFCLVASERNKHQVTSFDVLNKQLANWCDLARFGQAGTLYL